LLKPEAAAAAENDDKLFDVDVVIAADNTVRIQVMRSDNPAEVALTF